jgi:hypothetical protein
VLETTPTSAVEMLAQREGAFFNAPPLPFGGIAGAAAITVDESDSAAGQVLLLGGRVGCGPSENNVVPTRSVQTVHLVDLATGACTPQPNLLCACSESVAARLLDGRVIYAGGVGDGGDSLSLAEVLEPLVLGATAATRTWRALPSLSVGRKGCAGCVLSDGRFAVLGGKIPNDHRGFFRTSSCEALSSGVGGHWKALPPMHHSRFDISCAAVAKCVIVAGGQFECHCSNCRMEVFDEVLDRWLIPPCNLSHSGGALQSTGRALLSDC